MPFLTGIPNNKYQITNIKYYRRIGHWALGIGHLSFFAKRRGFTLIELLIVIAIIGILVAAGTYSWGAAQTKARDNRRKTDLKAIQQALESYYQTNGQYPAWDGWCNTISNSGDPTVLNALVSAHISAMPKDPLHGGTGQDYFYRQIDTNKYVLLSTIENIKDPDQNASGYTACSPSTFYTYQVTNP